MAGFIATGWSSGIAISILRNSISPALNYHLLWFVSGEPHFDHDVIYKKEIVIHLGGSGVWGQKAQDNL